MPSPAPVNRTRRPLVAAALVLVVMVGGGFRAWHASHPSERQSPDERAYLRLALSLAAGDRYGGASTGMSDPFHWAPGAPFTLGMVVKLDRPAGGVRSEDAPVAYWAQAVFGTLLILATFGIAATIGGVGAGVVAAAAVALYPPLVRITGEFLSEPLGSLLIAAAMLLSALSLRRRSLWLMLAAGVCLGLAVLTRANLLATPVLAGVALVVTLRRREGGARAATTAAVFVLGALVVIVPWSAYASQRVGRAVAVTTADGGPLFIGTYLPGDGTKAGVTRALAGEIRRSQPPLAHVPQSELTATQALEAVAARHPDREPSVALREEGVRNLSRYALHRPLAFASMMVEKVWSMWARPSAPGSWRPSRLTRVVHLAIVVLCLVGLLVGLARTREPSLVLLLVVLVAGTAVHTVFLASPRYALPLVPLLIAAGVAGAALARGQTASERVSSC